MSDQSHLQNYQNQVLDGFERVVDRVIVKASMDLADDTIRQGVFDALNVECHAIRQAIWQARDRIKVISH